MAIVYGLKVNLSVAMVIMVNSTALEIESLQNKGITNNCSEILEPSLTQQPTPINHTSTFLNENRLQERLAFCNALEQNITNLETKYRNLTETEKNEVSLYQSQVFSQNRVRNRLKKMSKPFS